MVRQLLPFLEMIECILFFQLGSNGYIALLDTTAYYNSIPSPLNLTLIAPFFEDIKPHDVSGVIYYRQTTSDTTSLQVRLLRHEADSSLAS